MTSLTLNNSLVSPLYDYPFTDTKNISLGNSTRFAGISTNMSSLRNASIVSLTGGCDSQSTCAAQKTWYNNFTGVIPNGVNLISAIVVGGGGGSGSTDMCCNNGGGTGGGGGGGLAYGYIRVNPGDTFRGYLGGGGGSGGRTWMYGYGGGQSRLDKKLLDGSWVTVMYGNGGGGTDRSGGSGGAGGGGAYIHPNYVLPTTAKYPSGAVAGGDGGSGGNSSWCAGGASGPNCPLNNVRYGGGGGGGRSTGGGRNWCDGSYGNGCGGGPGGGGQGGGQGRGDDPDWVICGGGQGADGFGGGAGGQGWRGTNRSGRGGNGTIIVTLNP